jgi:predicted NUDIX family NTP pyrophosphohydrolase
MPRKTSAGILPFRRIGPAAEYFLVHPGGPFWARKDAGAWSIAKGELDAGEDALAAARREFQEETGVDLGRHAAADFVPLAPLVQPGGKRVLAWALEHDCDAAAIRSNLCEVEWPPRSGRMLSIPEVDRASWFDERAALVKILKGQAGFIRELSRRLADAGG